MIDRQKRGRSAPWSGERTLFSEWPPVSTLKLISPGLGPLPRSLIIPCPVRRPLVSAQPGVVPLATVLAILPPQPPCTAPYRAPSEPAPHDAGQRDHAP